VTWQKRINTVWCIENELIDFYSIQIAHYKAPREIMFTDEIQRSAIGKVDKKRLIL
jgi:acyl-CoA synthetase (AMP-forming)/AMP-acid ligase II